MLWHPKLFSILEYKMCMGERRRATHKKSIQFSVSFVRPEDEQDGCKKIRA